MTKFVSLESFKEVGELCDKAVDAIVVNIETGKVMKVRWNACYVSTNTVSPLLKFVARKSTLRPVNDATEGSTQEAPADDGRLLRAS